MASFDDKVLQFLEYADKDDSSSIDLDELVQAFRKFGDYRSDAQIKELFTLMDGNKDKKVTFQELKDVLAKQTPRQKKEFNLRAAFIEIDKDKSGTIDVKELEGFLIKSGYADDAKAVMAFADKNGDGVINFEEFIAFVAKM